MSVTQTYYLAHTARGKLSSEAARADHNLRLLVGHANLLDSLMLELAEAEQEQQSWFDQSVRKASKSSSKPSHIQWADSIVEEPEEDWAAEDADSSDSDSEYDDDEDMSMEASTVTVQRLPQISTTAIEVDDEEEYSDDEEDLESLRLTHTTSHVASPPELDSDSDSSEEESMPPSPPTDSLLSFSEKQQLATTSYYTKPAPSISQSDQQALFDEGFYLPQRANQGLISAISVY